MTSTVATSEVDAASAFLWALSAGKAALHPTDTLPGLTFDPERAEGHALVRAFKGRDDGKPFLALASDLSAASRYWEPLPGAWGRILARLWPGPLSVVWQASCHAPQCLVAADGSLGLRVPRLGDSVGWFARALALAGKPLPTTSVNRAGESPRAEWRSAVLATRDRPGIYVPAARFSPLASPSTVIRLFANGGFEILRAGAMPLAAIEQAVMSA